MLQNHFMPTIILFLLYLIPFSTFAAEKTQKAEGTNIRNDILSYPPPQWESLHLDRAATLKIAEAVLIHIYGEAVLKQKPWIVTENKSDFLIEGTWHHKSGWKGGVAKIRISKKNAQVLECIHGR